MTGFSRAEAKRKQWDSDLQTRDSDSKELTKLGLEITEATGYVFRRHVWGSLYDSWDLYSSCHEFVQQFSCPNWCLQHTPALLSALLETDFREQVCHCCHCYYFILTVITTQILKIKLNKCFIVSK